MTNCIKNCFRSENRGHQSGGRGFYLLLHGFASSELVGRSPVHELRGRGSWLVSSELVGRCSVHELRAGGSWLVSSELTDRTGKLTFTEEERSFGTVKVN